MGAVFEMKSTPVFEPTAAVLITLTGCLDAVGVLVSGTQGAATSPNPFPPTGMGVPTWLSSNPTILPLTAQSGGLAATGVSTGAGSVTVTATASAPGGTITGTATVSFAAGVPFTFVMTITQLSAPPPPPPNP